MNSKQNKKQRTNEQTKKKRTQLVNIILRFVGCWRWWWLAKAIQAMAFNYTNNNNNKNTYHHHHHHCRHHHPWMSPNRKKNWKKNSIHYPNALVAITCALTVCCVVRIQVSMCTLLSLKTSWSSLFVVVVV